MKDFKSFIEANKKELYLHAQKNTPLNSEGRAMIPKGDEWVEETEWDERRVNLDVVGNMPIKYLSARVTGQ